MVAVAMAVPVVLVAMAVPVVLVAMAVPVVLVAMAVPVVVSIHRVRHHSTSIRNADGVTTPGLQAPAALETPSVVQ
jgi:hypothetical protein